MKKTLALAAALALAVPAFAQSSMPMSTTGGAMSSSSMSTTTTTTEKPMHKAKKKVMHKKKMTKKAMPAPMSGAMPMPTTMAK